MKLYSLLGASALATSLFAGTAAWAQVAPVDQAQPEKAVPAASATSPAADVVQDPTPETDNRGEVVVTGTRIRGVAGKLDQAVPVTTITAAELLGTRGDVSLGDALNQLPQLRTTFSQANSTGSIGTAGLNLLDLRGLGTDRTLTLVNGRRIVSATPGRYRPDVNTIPSDLVERVDLVTGGNSAIYGSDAIAGVVNFVLRRDFEGLRLSGQAGVTTYGDRPSQRLAAIAGHNFMDGKINVTAAAEYAHTAPLFYADRPYLGATNGVPGFITSEITTALNRNTDGIPNAAFLAPGGPGIKFGTFSTGGVVQTSCPLLNSTGSNRTQISNVCTGVLNPTGGRLNYYYDFLPNGTLVRDDASQGLFDNRYIGGGFIGGLSASGVEDAMLDPGLERASGNLLISGNFSDAFKPFIEASYTHVIALQQSTQPTFINGTLSPVFSVSNPFLTPQASATLTNILAPGATTFLLQRFNNDLGTRSEAHKRDTYRLVVGAAGDISPWGHLHYDVSMNYGRTDNFYVAGGNILLANYSKAVDAVLAPATYAGSNYVLNSQGQRVICAVNATTITDPACYPLNLFGAGQPNPNAANYILYPSSRLQRAQELDLTGYLSVDTGNFLNLPGGPISLVLGGEYRRESALSVYDAVTTASPPLTFLNSSAPFVPPPVKIKEVFGEAQVPLLRDFFLAKEVTANGSFRVSDYGGAAGTVVAWAAGGTWAPVSDFAVKFTYSRSVRAPNLADLYSTAAQTFANGFTDPCDQPGNSNTTNNITSNPNRARNCAAAGIPTTITYTDSSGNPVTRPWTNVATSGLAGVNQGNAGLTPEIGYTFSLTSVFKPHWVPGLSFETTYYNIRVKNVISGLTGQTIINRCYDDPVSISNPFCASIARRTATDAISNLTFNGQTGRVLDNLPNQAFALAGNGISFLNQPFNFASLATRGIDFDANYRHNFDNGIGMSLRVNAAYVITRRSYSYISDPGRYDRISGTGGDPQWQGSIFGNLTFKMFDLSYNARYVGKQIVSGLSYDTFFSLQNRAPLNPEARPFIFYPAIWYHNIRGGISVAKNFRFYAGVDNVTNEKPPYELAGNENFTSGSTAAIYPNTGRFYYAGFEAKF